MNYNYYPDINDENLQNKIYEKREFHANRLHEMKLDLDKYEDIKKYRDNICSGDFKLYSHQSFLSNFLNPNTPYKGLLIFHGVGTGKTGSAISISENFKDMVLKYGNKIHILVPGPLIKQNWKSEIIKFNNKNYYNNIINEKGSDVIIDKELLEKDLWNINTQFYRLISYRSFYKKVLGEKIKDITANKKKVRKIDGEIEREIPLERLESLDNTLLIVDEIHNLTKNDYGLALKKIIANSKNLKLVLLSATPMKNLADDIIDIINYLRPQNDPIKRDKIFNIPKYGYMLDIKKDGLEYLKNNINGYISYYRGAHPLLFAKQVDMGEIPKNLKFTKVIKCYMEEFQKNLYTEVQQTITDALEKSSESVSNFVFPALDVNKKKLIGVHGINGIKKIKNQLESDSEILLELLNKKFFNNKIKNINTIMSYNEQTNTINGQIFKKEYLKNFSAKFYTVLNNIDELINKKKGAKTAFIYSNLVSSGIDLFAEIMVQNGYLEFKDDGNYEIYDETKDYYTGISYKEFNNKNLNRQFYPATFLKITGKIDDYEVNEVNDKKNIIDNYFNPIENYEGKNLKFILGSKVMNEGITLENTGEVHILDVHYNLGKTYQVIGRAIRLCKHYKITNENNPFPEVKIYKYIIGLINGISSEELLYKKAEYKYVLVKKIERILKESAIDCPINYNGNIFKDELIKYKNCEKPIFEKKQNISNICPDMCDFSNCDFICNNKLLNSKYYDKNSKIYKLIEKKNLDYSTFTIDFAKNEINLVKENIKKIFKIKSIYTIEEILNIIEDINKKKNILFDNFFVFQALNKLIPETQNDFNNFSDIIYDKYNRSGYIIYINKYYIYQPFDMTKTTPLYYRNNYKINFFPNIGISSFIKNDKNYNIIKNIATVENNNKNYDFKSNENYYNNRKENDIIGIIDFIRKKNENNINDIFKLRPRRDKTLTKKRGTGIPSIKGAVCSTAKDKKELFNICKILKINLKKIAELSREDICKIIKEKLLFNEKFNEDITKKTYMIIPANHPIYEFPYNLQDRISYINNELNDKLKDKVNFKIEKLKNGIFEKKRDDKYIKYKITFDNKSKYDKNIIEEYKFVLFNNKWQIIIE